MRDSRIVGTSYGEEANYPEQAATYDFTRSASPTVSRLLLKYLGEPGGRTVLDIAGKFGLSPDDLNLDLGPVGKLM